MKPGQQRPQQNNKVQPVQHKVQQIPGNQKPVGGPTRVGGPTKIQTGPKVIQTPQGSNCFIFASIFFLEF